MLKAVIFDLDGVIADSHPIHEAAWKTLFGEQGLDAENLNLDFLYAGQPRGEIFRHFFGQLPDAKLGILSRRKDELYTALVGTLQPKPGLVRVLGELAAAGVAMAVGTSAQRRRTLETLDHFGIAERFGAVVTGDDVGATKPAPEIFLRAAALVHVQPANTVVVEDSPIGIEAARAAGMKCVGYATPDRIEQLRKAGADDLILEFPPTRGGIFRASRRARRDDRRAPRIKKRAEPCRE